jgi:hypothetical protein
MRALLKAVARTASASISSASSIQFHLKVLLCRLQLSTVHRLVLHVVPILQETIANNSADTHGMENHQCYMELMGSP